jgi:methyl-accepting chemotaxis protein
MKRGRSIRREITTLLIAVALLPLLAISLVSFYTLQNNLRRDFESIVHNSLGQVTRVFSESNKNNNEIVDYFSLDPNARNILKDQESSIWILKTFESYATTHKDVDSIYIGTIEGKTYVYPSTNLSSNYDPRTRDWYKKALESDGKTIMTEPYVDEFTKEYVVTYAKSVQDLDGKLVGVFAIDVKLTEITQLVHDIVLGKNGFSTIITEEGSILAHRDESLMGKNVKDKPWVTEILNIKDDNVANIKIDGINYLTFKMRDEQSDLIVAGLVPAKEITDTIIKAMVFPAAILLASLIIILILGKIFSDRIVNPIRHIVQILSLLKIGDFTGRAEIKKNHSMEIKEILLALNSVIEDMVVLLNQVRDTSNRVKEASQGMFVITNESSEVGEEVARAVQQIAEGATSQAAELETGSEIALELGKEVNNSTENAAVMLRISKEVKDSTTDGLEAINILKDSFRKQNDANTIVQQKVSMVSEKSNQIGAIIDTIKNITEQTNLLALNASIEAARAGDAGRGFAVVAEEVRKLAEESASSAGEIGKVVIEIKESVQALYQQSMYAKELNSKTGESVITTSDRFMSITKMVDDLEESVNKVGDSLKEINSSKDTVVSKISEVAIVSQQTAAAAEEVSASSEEQASGLQEIVASAEKLKGMAEVLDELVGKFRL